MWFHTNFFIPPSHHTFSGEQITTSPLSATFTGEKESLGSCHATFSGIKR